MNGRLGVLIGVMLWGGAHISAGGQAPVAPVAAPVAVDAALEGAKTLIGRAIFLRGSYAGDQLEYDALGHVKGQPKVVDWTLAGANIEKVSRREGANSDELELDGFRVAMRYNTDQHVFERHPQKDQKLRIFLAVNADARGLQGALATIFSTGIDPALQRAMPPYWRHYFSPALAWPADDLVGQTVIPFTAAQGIEAPVIEKKLEPEFTSEARADHVKGVVQAKLVVGVDGLPRHISIRMPLGYGLDEKVAETVAKYRFHPGMKDGKPIAVEMLVNQTFDYYPPIAH